MFESMTLKAMETVNAVVIAVTVSFAETQGKGRAGMVIVAFGCQMRFPGKRTYLKKRCLCE
jgi:hypothetical protein